MGKNPSESSWKSVGAVGLIVSASLLVAVIGFTGVFLARKNTEQNSRGQWADDRTYIFSDRSDPRLERLYAIHKNEVVVQVAVFPGYSDRELYRCASISDDLMARIKTWAVRSRDFMPPFEPHGPWYSRISLDPGREEHGEAWFSNENESVQEWFAELQRAFITNEQRVRKCPSWIEEDQRIKRYFGL